MQTWWVPGVGVSAEGGGWGLGVGKAPGGGGFLEWLNSWPGEWARARTRLLFERRSLQGKKSSVMRSTRANAIRG